MKLNKNNKNRLWNMLISVEKLRIGGISLSLTAVFKIILPAVNGIAISRMEITEKMIRGSNNDFITDFDEIQSSWAGIQPNIVCLDTCGSTDGGTNFTNQWQREVQLC